MQSKVSMVIPCYNKVQSIGEMFDSIIAQKWNNIELIIVNDGSTDGTREIIAKYEPKFIAREFEVVIIDQENAGVCAAGKAGLLGATGEYICMVDSDDELAPNYVSTMAGWMEENSDCDFCVCEAIEYTGDGENKKFANFIQRGPAKHESNYLERYLMAYIRQTVWVYMVRKHYLQKCRILETYYTETTGSHEPGYIIPIWAYGGKFKYFSDKLYRFNNGGEGHSRPPKLEKKLKFSEEYCRLCSIAIDELPDEIAMPQKKRILKIIAAIARDITSYNYARELIDEQQRLYEILINSINTSFTPPPVPKGINSEDIPNLIQAVENYILGIRPASLITRPTGRVIVWGSQGKRGVRFLPLLTDSAIEPTELWDIAGDGINVKKPDLKLISKDDLVLIMPIGDVGEKIRALIGNTCAVMLSDDIARYLAFNKYRQFYDGSLNFVPQGD